MIVANIDMLSLSIIWDSVRNHMQSMAGSMYALRVNPVALLVLSLLITVPAVMLLSTPSLIWDNIDKTLDTVANQCYSSVINSYRIVRSWMHNPQQPSGARLNDSDARIARSSTSAYSIGRRTAVWLCQIALGLGYIIIVAPFDAGLWLRFVLGCIVAVDEPWYQSSKPWQRRCSFVARAILFGLLLQDLVMITVLAVDIITSSLVNAYPATRNVVAFPGQVWAGLVGFARFIFHLTCVCGMYILFSMPWSLCAVVVAFLTLSREESITSPPLAQTLAWEYQVVSVSTPGDSHVVEIVSSSILQEYNSVSTPGNPHVEEIISLDIWQEFNQIS